MPPKKKRLKVLFVAEAISLAHIGRTVTLASALDFKRFEIEFACDRRYRQFVPIEFQFHHIQSLSQDIINERLRRGQPLYNSTEMLSFIQEDETLLSSRQPDLVINDFRLSLAVSCRQLKIPIWTLSNAHWSPDVQAPFPVTEMFPFRYLGWKSGNYLFSKIPKFILDWFLQRHGAVFFKNRAKSLSSNWDVRRIYCEGDETLFLDSDQFIGLKKRGRHQSFIGPVIWEPPVSPKIGSSIKALGQSTKSMIYVTLGSSGSTEIIDYLIDALSNWDGLILLSTAGRFSRPLPVHFKCFKFVPAMEIIPHCQFVICNGGSGTVYQALVSGVPVIGLVTNTDQAWTMLHTEAAGAGLAIRSREVTPKRLKVLFGRIVHPSFKSKALMIKADFGRFNSGETFAKKIDEWSSKMSNCG